MPKVYNYNAETKIYIDTTAAVESPLEPGVFLYPAHSTEIPVPELTINQYAVWNEDTKEWTTNQVEELQVSTDIVLDPRTQEQKIFAERMRELYHTDYLVIRHRDQVDAGTLLSLSADEYKSILVYRQALRDLPENKDFPNVVLPVKPDFYRNNK